MISKENELITGEQLDETNSEVEKQTQYVEDDHEKVELLDKELALEGKKQAPLFPSINKQTKNNEQKRQKYSMKKEEKLPELTKSQKNLSNHNNSPPPAKKIETETYVICKENKEVDIQETKIQKVVEISEGPVQNHQDAQVKKEVGNQKVQISEQSENQDNSNEESPPEIKSQQLTGQPSTQQLHQEQPKQEEAQKQENEQQAETLTKVMETALQTITCFNSDSKSNTILFQDMENSSAFQSANYYQNHKLLLTHAITSQNSTCRFRIQNIKYCVGFGVALKEVIEKHGYDYQSQGSNQLSHGLYIVTSQGYSWSHSEKEEDDIPRNGFNQLYNGLTIEVNVCGQQITFKWKKGEFKLTLPARIRQKYTLCYCAYLHQKSDAISISA